MPIEFDLRGLHPTFRRPVVDVLVQLDEDFPLDCVRRVALYDGPEGDHSMGHSDIPGLIRLNRFWFARPIDELEAAARTNEVVPWPGGDIPWHGGMAEPQHLLTHEFFHQLQNRVEWCPFAERGWRGCCEDPVNQRPPTGYAASGPDEYWGETGAAMVLISTEMEATRLMRELIDAEMERLLA